MHVLRRIQAIVCLKIKQRNLCVFIFVKVKKSPFNSKNRLLSKKKKDKCKKNSKFNLKAKLYLMEIK